MAEDARPEAGAEGAGPPPPLSLPRSFAESPLWRDPLHVAWYIRLQLAADEDGRIHNWSLRKASRWLQCTAHQMRRFLETLDDHQLIHYPGGVHINRPYTIELREYWGEPRTANGPEGGPDRAQRGNGAVPGNTAVPNGAPRTANRELFPEIVAQQEQEKERVTQRLMELVHKMGLDEDPAFTGPLWAKQAKVVNRLLEAHGPDATERAIRGMPLLYPWSEPDGPPWDAYHVEKHFPRAAAAYGRKLAERRAAGAQREAVAAHVETRAVEDAQRQEAVTDWAERVRAKIREEPEDVQRDYLQRGVQEALAVPVRGKEQKKKLAVQFALRAYGEAVGDPPPSR